MRLLFHIGTHKTATTSIQHYLHQNSALMASRGILYPSYDLIGAKPHYAHLGMSNALVGEHHRYDRAQAELFFRTVAERSKDYDLTILSAEPAYRQTAVDDFPGDHSEETYWTRRMAYIQRLADLMPDAEIVIVFRRQAEYAQSLYQETVKKQTYGKGFRAFLKSQAANLDYISQTKAWAKAFPSLQVMTFEELVRTGEVEKAFCEGLGISTEGFSEPERQNEGMHGQLVLLKRLINSFAKSNDDALARTERIATMLGPDRLKAIGKCSFFGSIEAEASFQAKFQSDNQMLADFCSDADFASRTICQTDMRPKDVFGEKPDPRILRPLLAQLTAP